MKSRTHIIHIVTVEMYYSVIWRLRKLNHIEKWTAASYRIQNEPAFEHTEWIMWLVEVESGNKKSHEAGDVSEIHWEQQTGGS